MNPSQSGGGFNMAPSYAQIGSEVIGNVAGAITSRKNTKDTIQANREMAEYAYSKDLEMWNKQNEYNSPAAQMARLKSAGINPAVMYGHGAVGNTTGNLPKYQAPNIDYSGRKPYIQPMNVLGPYLDLMTRKQGIEESQARIRKLDQDTELKKVDLLLKNLSSRKGEWQFSKMQEKYSFDVQMWNEQIKKLKTDIDINRQNLSLGATKGILLNQQIGLNELLSQLRTGQISKQAAETRLKKLEADMLEEYGIKSGEAGWTAASRQAYQGLKDIIQSIYDYLRE